MKTKDPFGIMFSNRKHNNKPLTIGRFSHGDLMTSFLLDCSLGNVFLSFFIDFFAGVCFILCPQISFATPSCLFFVLFCSRLSVVWIVLPAVSFEDHRNLSWNKQRKPVCSLSRKLSTTNCVVFLFYFGKGFYFNTLFWKERKIAELILNSIYRKKYGGHLLNTCADKNSKMRRC